MNSLPHIKIGLFIALTLGFYQRGLTQNTSRVVDPSLIDQTVSPCDDFFQYSCGEWLKKTEIPKDRSSLYRFSEIDISTEKLLKGILEKYQAGKYEPQQKYAPQMGMFYRSCINESASSRDARKRVSKLLKDINVLANNKSSNYKESLTKMVASLHKKGVPVFFGFYVDQDPGDARQVIPQIDQGGQGLPEKGYYLDQEDEEKKKTRLKYKEHLAKMFEIVGEKNGVRLAKDAYSIEESLAKVSLSPIERRDPKATYHKMNLEDIKALAPDFDWALYFKLLGVPENVQFNVTAPDFFKGLNQIFKTASSSEIKKYLKWYSINSVAGHSFKELIREDFNFNGKFLNGQKAMKPRWKECVASIDSYLGEALGEAFVSVSFSPEAKNLSAKMMSQIQDEVRRMFSTLDWMDQNTANGAIKKLGTLVKKVGYPEPSRNYDSFKVNKDSWFENITAGHEFELKRQVAKIGKPLDRGEWGMTASTNNAYYNALMNEIVFPAGILQEPLFSINADLAANYGATGATIGHEITHGFDDEGRQFDENGNLNDWWTEASVKNFKEKAQCLVTQYDQYTVADGVHLKGELTLGENIADLGGLKIALNSYKKASPAAPTSLEFQRFFVAYAQSWCGKATPEYEKNIVQVDPHSPARYRVNGVVVNMPEFSQAFSCKAGQAMNPPKRCEVW